MEVSKELRADIERNQTKLKIAIRNHQMLVLKRKADPDNLTIKTEIDAAQNDIVNIGLGQKDLIERLRKELKGLQKAAKSNATKLGLEERRSNLTSILNKSRKQILTVRSGSVSSITSDDSLDALSESPSPVSTQLPQSPHELTQVDFLGRVGLCTHEVFKELQNRRVERKRRSTANPQFLYGNKWDHASKRKKNSYLISLSPPNTRQSAKNRLRGEQRIPSPPSLACPEFRSKSPHDKKTIPIGLNIPNLPSGLTIERINGNNQSPDRVCLICRTSGTLSVCETCNGCYHVSCHNRPLVQQPRQCPKCLGKRDAGTRDVGSLSVPPSMTVLTTYVSAAEVKEKTQEKQVLLEKNKQLHDELNQLEGRVEALTASLKAQASVKEELLNAQRVTRGSIERVLDFVGKLKRQSTQRAMATTPLTNGT